MLRLTEASDPYFERMALVITDEVPVRSASGQPVDPDTLVDGMRVEVQVRGGCRESYPVSCDLGEVSVLER